MSGPARVRDLERWRGAGDIMDVEEDKEEEDVNAEVDKLLLASSCSCEIDSDVDPDGRMLVSEYDPTQICR